MTDIQADVMWTVGKCEDNFRNCELEKSSVDAGYCSVTMQNAPRAVVRGSIFTMIGHPKSCTSFSRGVLLFFFVTVGEWSL